MAACYTTDRIQLTTNYTPRRVHFALIFRTAGMPDSGALLPVLWEAKTLWNRRDAGRWARWEQRPCSDNWAPAGHGSLLKQRFCASDWVPGRQKPTQ